MGHVTRRGVLTGAAGAAVLVATNWRASASPTPTGAATWKKRLTGEDLDTAERWEVAGTDLGIPYVLENGSIGYLFGDTFATARPERKRGWRAPVMLRSAVPPGDPGGIVFDSAARVRGDGFAPEIMHNGHRGEGMDGIVEVSALPNDGISFPETGRQIVSYWSVQEDMRSNYAGLAFSDNGNDFQRAPVRWDNDRDHTDPFQFWTMQRDGDWVYVFSVRDDRKRGPMMLQRVPWDRMLDKDAYEGWGHDGTSWRWGRPCSPILEGHFGEPSVRRLGDGTWVMAYLRHDTLDIVTRVADGPDRVWSDEKVQVTYAQEQNLYGGFIHPWSTSAPNDLHLMVSTWRHDERGLTTAYHVSQYVGTV